MKKREIVVIAHNIRSTHNVGSILRTCDGLGVSKVYFSGYSPYPIQSDDARLPHIANKLEKQISKTSLGAEKTVPNEYIEDVFEIIKRLKKDCFSILALEQDKKSIKLNDYLPESKIVLILGEEVDGIEPKILKICDQILEIPMFGQKESFNVSVATGIALYHLKTTN